MARRNAALAALGPFTLSLALIACSGSATSSPAQGVAGETALASSPSGTAGASGQGGAEATACHAIQTWSDEMQALVAMDAKTASVDDVRAQLDKIKAAWEDIKTSLEAVQVADEKAVVTAGDKLETEIDNVKTDIPIADMVSQVKTAAQPLKNVYMEMADGLGCTIKNPY
jgi:hypothetical protein